MSISKISPRRLARFQQVAMSRQRGLILVLEDISDPHNAAACLRSADAFGVQEVWFVFEKQKVFNPAKVGKVTSSSANKWLDYRIFRSVEECLKELKKKKYTIAVTVLQGEAKHLQSVKYAQYDRLALVMGNEHSGVSSGMREAADLLLTLPMRGFVESLNLSVATSLFLYEIVRQRDVVKRDFHLSASEQNKLVKKFTSR